jgi:hypothetical protein
VDVWLEELYLETETEMWCERDFRRLCKRVKICEMLMVHRMVEL